MDYSEYIKYQIFSNKQTIAGIKASDYSNEVKTSLITAAKNRIVRWEVRLEEWEINNEISQQILKEKSDEFEAYWEEQKNNDT